MQPRIPRQSAGEQGGRRPEGTDLDDRFSAELASAVSGARRRAVRDGDRQIDTAHLLHSLLECDAEARALLGDGPRIARLLGYLVQRSIGYGLRWQSSVEDSGAVPVVPGVAGFSPLAAAAMEAACARAARRGVARACGVDLLAALVADPQARAVEVLARAAVEPHTVLARVESHFEPTP
ncbi:Clp protease N-terminal domain-containing protein [Streptomyces sp. AC512_CC834]|uniref:Clp protease N-terminal domain-containing protein n=1 Tax=Streptomyces sp. AC512_CC834 TaxID=2823691 RepID=UPI001C263391|nr:Clp protease N-terminal domain-containing protein [Streptomyces sp. AC512_CC834]